MEHSGATPPWHDIRELRWDSGAMSPYTSTLLLLFCWPVSVEKTCLEIYIGSYFISLIPKVLLMNHCIIILCMTSLVGVFFFAREMKKGNKS